MRVKVKILCPLNGVYAELQPEVGEVYEANYNHARHNKDGQRVYAPVCIIDVKGKKICLRPNEYEFFEE